MKALSRATAEPQTLGQTHKGRMLSHQGDATVAIWLNGFTRTKTGNYVGSFFLGKKSSDIVITARINIFKSDRTTRPNCHWTWAIQITDGPRRMVMEAMAYSNLYFEGPQEAAIHVRDDLRAGGYTPTQPPRSSLVAAIAKEQHIAERIAEAEDRSFARKPARTRVIDT
jgi:hypothetical protein